MVEPRGTLHSVRDPHARPPRAPRAPAPSGRAALLAALLAAVLPAVLAACVGRAAAGPALRLGFGSLAASVPRSSVEPRDTAGVGIYMDLDTLSAALEGVEFLVVYPCWVDASCRPTRDVDVLAFEPDRSLIGTAESKPCDEICACNQCQTHSHYHLHFRTDRLSTMPRRARLGTLHVRTTVPTRAAELAFALARIRAFGRTPLESRWIDVTLNSVGARFGGITPAGETRWGVLRRMYR